MNKKALVLAGGVPQIKLINSLKSRGYYVILADYYENPVAKKYADQFYRESTLDIDAIRKIAIEEKIDMIITCCTDQALATVSKIAEELGLPCYCSEEIGLMVTNKQYMKNKLKDNNIPTANFNIVKDIEDVTFRKFPMVVKPVDCNSSKGVVKVNTEQELKKAIKNATDLSRTNTAIVEEYIDGKEISVDILVKNGIAHILCTSFSEKIKDNQKFVIYKGQYPAIISLRAYQNIKEIAQKIVDAFKLKNCPMLIQVLNKGNDIYVIEFSARTGGCVKYRMIELATDVDIINTTIDIFEGKDFDIRINKKNKVIVNEFIYCFKGIFSKADGFDLCLKNNWITDFYILKNFGESFEKVQNSGDRVAAITYCVDKYNDYVKNHNHVIENIRIIDECGNDIMRHDLLPALEEINE